MKKIAIAGAGFSGAVIARALAQAGHQVDVFDARPHVAGNCHTERDAETGVMVQTYGPHIFHTSNDQVWNYIREFDEFMPFTNRVKAITGGRIFTLPVNLLTINQFFGKTFNPVEAQEFLLTLSEGGDAEPVTFEEQALKFVGREFV
jgi:UDP-galactopyranose mutase